MRFVAWAFLGSVLCVGSCAHTLADAPCPCAEGFTCCASMNRCYPAGKTCESSGGRSDDAGGASSAGKLNMSGASVGGSGGSGGSAGEQSIVGGGGSGAGSGSLAEGGSVAGSAGALSLTNTRFELVSTAHNDAARTGANLHETTLDVTNVNLAQFGELSRRTVRGAIFAQPLLVPDLALADGSRADVLYVATMANRVYALDARHPEAAPIWSRFLADPIQLPDLVISPGSNQIWHEIGVLGTPVISSKSAALYAVGASKLGDTYAHRLYKLDLASGNVTSVAIEHAGFESWTQIQRSALALEGGVVYVPFGAYEHNSSGGGWIFSFDENLNALGQVKLGTPSGAGITMGGQGPAVDGGSLFFTTSAGNESVPDSSSFGSRLLELNPSNTAQVRVRLFPSAAQSTGTRELPSSGPLVIPGANRVVTVGQHRIYVVSRDAGEAASSSPLQVFRPSGPGLCEQIAQTCETQPGSPVFWPGSGAAPQPRLFIWPVDDTLRAFAFDPNSGRFACPDDSDVQCQSLPANLTPGDTKDAKNSNLQSAASLSVSSNGHESGSGIVWASHAYNTDPLHNPDGILRAFSADKLSLLWSSQDAGPPVGPHAPGLSPTVSGGRVFLGTAEGLFEKATFWGENIDGAPALANFGDQYLVTAWGTRAGAAPGFQIEWSDGHVTYTSGGFVAGDFLSFEPSLAFGGSRIYLAYTDPNFYIKVASSDHPSFSKPTYLTQRTAGGDPVPLFYYSTTAPALAYGNGRLFLAYHRGAELRVLTSKDGISFDTESLLTFPGQAGYRAPMLSYVNGKLYLIMTSTSDEMRLFVSSDDGASFAGPTPLSGRSTGHPALLAFDQEGSSAPDLQLAWADTSSEGGEKGRIKLASVSDGNFQQLTRIHALQAEQAQYSVTAAKFRGAWYFAWLGIDGATHPNVARYTPGELITYGLKTP
jgi:hypothetical protein